MRARVHSHVERGHRVQRPGGHALVHEQPAQRHREGRRPLVARQRGWLAEAPRPGCRALRHPHQRGTPRVRRGRVEGTEQDRLAYTGFAGEPGERARHCPPVEVRLDARQQQHVAVAQGDAVDHQTGPVEHTLALFHAHDGPRHREVVQLIAVELRHHLRPRLCKERLDGCRRRRVARGSEPRDQHRVPERPHVAVCVNQLHRLLLPKQDAGAITSAARVPVARVCVPIARFPRHGVPPRVPRRRASRVQGANAATGPGRRAA